MEVTKGTWGTRNSIRKKRPPTDDTSLRAAIPEEAERRDDTTGEGPSEINPKIGTEPAINVSDHRSQATQKAPKRTNIDKLQETIVRSAYQCGFPKHRLPKKQQKHRRPGVNQRVIKVSNHRPPHVTLQAPNRPTSTSCKIQSSIHQIDATSQSAGLKIQELAQP